MRLLVRLAILGALSPGPEPHLFAAPVQEVLRVRVALVTVPVLVTDRGGRVVNGLEARHFTVFEDGVKQPIAFFSSAEQPVTLGIVLDRSDSMKHSAKLERAKAAALAIVRECRPDDELFYLPFDDRVEIAVGLTADRAAIESAIEGTRTGGGTSLYDAILEGLAHARKGMRRRRTLVVVTDGADQHSGHTLEQVVAALQESQVQLYMIGYFSPYEDAVFRASGPRVLLMWGIPIDNPRVVFQRLAEESGAASFFPRSDKELAEAARAIAGDLRAQYTLAYYPSHAEAERRYRRIEVKVSGGRYRVRARPGYAVPGIAPSEPR